MAASLAELHGQVQQLAVRVDALGAARQPPTSTRQPAAAMPAPDTAQAPGLPPLRGRPKSLMRQRIDALLAEHPEGLTAEEIRFYLRPERPLGDILGGMRLTRAVRWEGAGTQRRYFLVDDA